MTVSAAELLAVPPRRGFSAHDLAAAAGDAEAGGAHAEAVLWRWRSAQLHGTPVVDDPAASAASDEELRLLFLAGLPLGERMDEMVAAFPDWPVADIGHLRHAPRGASRLGDAARVARDDDPEGAVAAYRHALALDPSNIGLHRQLARHLAKLRWLFEAHAAWEALRKLAPYDEEAVAQLARLAALLVADEVAEAAPPAEQETFDAPIEADPYAAMPPSAVRAEADAATAAGDLDTLECIARSLAADRLSPGRRDLAGRALLEGKRYGPAMALLRPAIADESISATTLRLIESTMAGFAERVRGHIAARELLPAIATIAAARDFDSESGRVRMLAKAVTDQLLGAEFARALAADDAATVEQVLASPFGAELPRGEQEAGIGMLLAAGRYGALREPVARLREQAPLGTALRRAISVSLGDIAKAALALLQGGDVMAGAELVRTGLELDPGTSKLRGVASAASERLLLEAVHQSGSGADIEAMLLLAVAIAQDGGVMRRALLMAGRIGSAEVELHARIALVEVMPDDRDNLQAAARLARDLRRGAETEALYDQLVAIVPGAAHERARALSEVQRSDAALAAWQALAGDPQRHVEALHEQVRILARQDGSAAILALVTGSAALLAEVDAMEVRDANMVWDILARAGHSARRLRTPEAIEPIETAFAAGPPTATMFALRAALADYRNARQDARDLLDRAAALPPIGDDRPRHLAGERALHHAGYGEFADALASLKAVPESKAGQYRDRLDYLLRLAAQLGPPDPGALYPESLLDRFFDQVEPLPPLYAPEAGHVLIVSSSLGRGGAEKEAVTLLRAMHDDSRAAHLFFAVRSIHLRPTHGVLKPLVDALPIKWKPYGLDWTSHRPAKRVAAAIPPELMTLIELMPYNMSEELLRVAELILEHRPQVVHIWQDMHAVAMACMLCGVPHFFIHRGSLSPDFWAFDDRQWATHFRVMRHAYKRMAERPGFLMLNNSQAGCRADANWLELPCDDRFRVLRNAVDFAAMGPVGPNPDLRARLGIPGDAFVVGGAFRLVPVKRPMLWIEAARHIAEAVPTARFVVIGGGDQTEQVAAYAAAHGFADRLHLIGRVQDVGAYYRIMDVTLLTSEREGVPNAVIEAQHFGVPVVATDVGGIAEAIDPGTTGFAVRGQDAWDYVERVCWIARKPEWRAAAAVAAPGFVGGRYSLANVVAELMELYGL